MFANAERKTILNAFEGAVKVHSRQDEARSQFVAWCYYHFRSHPSRETIDLAVLFDFIFSLLWEAR